MRDFDEMELDGGSSEEDPELDGGGWRPEPRDEPPRRLFLFLFLLILVAALLGAWWWWRNVQREPVPDEPVATTAPERPVAEPTGAMEEPDRRADAIELSGSDEIIRQVAVGLSENPRFAAWLVNDGLVERFVKVVANVAYGEDPRAHIPFMKPGRAFSVDERNGTTVISPRAHGRYEPIIATFESLDVDGSAELYRRLEPAMEQAFAELGLPGTFRETLDRAVDRVLDADVPSGDIEVVENVLSYRFADPALESRSAFDKLLLRLGPRNLERLQAVVREMDSAIEAPDSMPR